MNFAILSAVSTKKQATEDKISLEVQETRSRELGQSKLWKETAGPFRIPGASRSFYVNLSDAEADIPQLAAMLNAAQSRRFDVLIFYSYDRLGDLANSIAQALRFYGVQLLSVSQGTEVQSPDQFDPYLSDAESNMRTMAQMTQQFRIADMRRKFRKGMEGRVDAGLPSIRIPYGYSKPIGREWDARAIPVQVPAHAQVVLEIKERFLHGQTYYDIMNAFNAKGIPTPEAADTWSHTTIKKILLNPFYAGKVFFGRKRVSRDVRLRTKTPRMVHNPNAQIRDGKHQALYSWEIYQAILAEIQRREALPRNNRFQFSGLLTCTVCGKHLKHNKGWWRCPHHVGISDGDALIIIPKLMQRALQNADSAAPAPTAPQPDTARELQELTRQRRRIQQAYEAEVYTVNEAEKKIKDIDAKINALKNNEDNQLRKQASRKAFIETLARTKEIIDLLPQWVSKDDPRQVNLLLLRYFRTITISPDLKFTVHLQD